MKKNRFRICDDRKIHENVSKFENITTMVGDRAIPSESPALGLEAISDNGKPWFFISW